MSLSFLFDFDDIVQKVISSTKSNEGLCGFKMKLIYVLTKHRHYWVKLLGNLLFEVKRCISAWLFPISNRSASREIHETFVTIRKLSLPFCHG